MDFSKISEGAEYESKKSNENGTNAEGLVFYSSREHRLQSAPQIVRDFYDGKYRENRPGLFKALVATRANRLILFALLVCAAVVFVQGFFGSKSNRAVLAQIPLELKAFSVDEKIYVSLKAESPEKKMRDSYKDGVLLNAQFSGIDADGTAILSENDSAQYKGKEIFLRATMSDFDVVSVTANVSIENDDGKESLNIPLKVKVERR